MTIHLPCCPFAPERYNSLLVDLSLMKSASVNFIQVEVKMLCIALFWLKAVNFHLTTDKDFNLLAI